MNYGQLGLLLLGMLTVKYTTRRREQTHSPQEITRDDENNILANATYCYGPRGAECKRDNLTQTERWYVLDGLGSVLAEVNEQGQAKANHRCDVWGNDRLLDPGDPKSKHAFVGNLGHTSGDTPGLIYMRARWYDPTVGRFISEDPAGNGSNWYAYCNGNPANLADHSGLVPNPVWRGAAQTVEDLGRTLHDVGMGYLKFALYGMGVAAIMMICGLSARLTSSTPIVGPLLGMLGVELQLEAGHVALGCVALAGYAIPMILVGNIIMALGEDYQAVFGGVGGDAK